MLHTHKLVKYIGNKPEKRDTVAGTGFIWLRGESLPVEINAANKLLKFRAVWQEVRPELPESISGSLADLAGRGATEPTPPAQPVTDNKTDEDQGSDSVTISEEMINDMDEAQLADLVEAADLNVKFTDKDTLKTMRAKVLKAAEAG